MPAKKKSRYLENSSDQNWMLLWYVTPLKIEFVNNWLESCQNLTRKLFSETLQEAKKQQPLVQGWWNCKATTAQ